MLQDHDSHRRAQLQAQHAGRLTPAQIDAVLADEALFRGMGEAVGAALKSDDARDDDLKANGELPFVPLFPEAE